MINKSYLLEKLEKKIERSVGGVFNYMKNRNSYGKNIKERPASILSPINKRAILTIAYNSSDSIPKIKVKAGVQQIFVHTHTVVFSNEK